MFAKITIFLAILAAVNATAHLGAVFLNHAAPAKTIVSRRYVAPVAVAHAVPVAVAHAAPVAYSASTVVRHAAPVVVAHSIPVAVAHAPIGYSRSHESKYFGSSKYASAHGYSTHSEVNHAHGHSSSSTVVQHAAPVVVSHVAPLAVGHVAYNTGVLGHGLLGHRLGGVVYNGNKYIHY